jgi:hypothetical protein
MAAGFRLVKYHSPSAFELAMSRSLDAIQSAGGDALSVTYQYAERSYTAGIYYQVPRSKDAAVRQQLQQVKSAVEAGK